MSMMASSDDPPVDLEKAVVTEVKAAATVNPRVAMCVMVLVDAVAVLEVLIFIGLIAWRLSVSKYWWDPLIAFVVLLLCSVLILWMKPKTNYAMAKAKLALASDNDSDLATKLVAQ
ncbi:unnamed protein product [Urochloa humidicola]